MFLDRAAADGQRKSSQKTANDRLWSYFYLFSKGFREYLVIDFGKGNFFFFKRPFILYSSQLTINLELFR
jgi:hypothetical protein